MSGESRNPVGVDADVEREHDAVGPELAQPRDDIRGMSRRSTADDDASDSQLEPFPGDLATAHAAAELQRCTARLYQPGDCAAVVLRCRARAVEVHDVNVPGTEFRELSEQFARVVGIDFLGVVAALEQAHAAPSAQV